MYILHLCSWDTNCCFLPYILKCTYVPQIYKFSKIENLGRKLYHIYVLQIKILVMQTCVYVFLIVTRSTYCCCFNASVIVIFLKCCLKWKKKLDVLTISTLLFSILTMAILILGPSLEYLQSIPKVLIVNWFTLLDVCFY
jgi:hypothetical protein